MNNHNHIDKTWLCAKFDRIVADLIPTVTAYKFILSGRKEKTSLARPYYELFINSFIKRKAFFSIRDT